MIEIQRMRRKEDAERETETPRDLGKLSFTVGLPAVEAVTVTVNG